MLPLKEFLQRMRNNQRTKNMTARACTSDQEPKNFEMLNDLILRRLDTSGRQSISHYPEINQTLRSAALPGKRSKPKSRGSS